MKVILATDFSPSSIEARQLAVSLTWPAETHIDVIHVLEPLSGDLLEIRPEPLESELSAAEIEVSAFADGLQQGLAAGRRLVHGSTAVGDPATVIAERADKIGADLIIVGSRGRGRIGSTLLGSVSAGIVDRAPCSVLVARTTSVERLILADDGSEQAAAASGALQQWGLFDQAAITVASVVDVFVPTDGGLGMGASIDIYTDTLGSSRKRASAIVDQRVAELLRRGRTADGIVLEGGAAFELLHLARSRRSDLIVLAHSGKGAFARLLSGSVARSALFDFEGSVLVARPLHSHAEPDHAQFQEVV